MQETIAVSQFSCQSLDWKTKCTRRELFMADGCMYSSVTTLACQYYAILHVFIWLSSVTYRYMLHYRGEELAEKYLRKLQGRLLRCGFLVGIERGFLASVDCNRGKNNLHDIFCKLAIAKQLTLSVFYGQKVHTSCCKICNFSQNSELILAAIMIVKAYFQQYLNDRNII